MKLQLRLPLCILLALFHLFTLASVKTGTLGVQIPADEGDLVPGEHALTVHPEPMNSAIVIEFLLCREGAVCLSLFNCIGQEVGAWEWENLERGIHHLKLIDINLSSGLYFLSLHAASAHVTKKVMYVR